MLLESCSFFPMLDFSIISGISPSLFFRQYVFKFCKWGFLIFRLNFCLDENGYPSCQNVDYKNCPDIYICFILEKRQLTSAATIASHGFPVVVCCPLTLTFPSNQTTASKCHVVQINVNWDPTGCLQKQMQILPSISNVDNQKSPNVKWDNSPSVIVNIND